MLLASRQGHLLPCSPPSSASSSLATKTVSSQNWSCWNKNSCAKNLQISINQMSNVIMITIIVVIAIIVTCHRHLNWVITISSWPSASISCLLSLWFPSYHRSGSHNHPMINQIDNQCRHYLTNWSVCHQHSSSSSLCSWSCSCREQICAQSRGSLPFMRSPVLVMSTKYSKIPNTPKYQIL